MHPLECYALEEAVKGEYVRLPKNIWKKGNLNSESNRNPSQTTQISNTPQGEKALLKYVVVHGIDKAILEDERDDSFQRLIRSHKVGVTKPFKNPITRNNGRVKATETPNPTKLYIYFIFYYHLLTHGRPDCARTAKGE